jgi:DNA-binding XRE family transcriptional regulator
VTARRRKRRTLAEVLDPTPRKPPAPRLPAPVRFPSQAEIGAVFKSVREQSYTHQRDMAAALGISQSTYSRLESGRMPLTVEQLLRACAALDIEPSAVFDELRMRPTHTKGER